VSANLDLVRLIYSDWERGDFSKADWADSEIEFVSAEGPEPGSSTGPAYMAKGVRAWLSGWEDFRIEADEFRELDGERVLVLNRRSGRGKTSGLEIKSKGAALFHISGGKVTKHVAYFDRDCALADLGLEASAMAGESTTPDLLELARRINEAINRRDFDAVISFWAPDAVYVGRLGTFEGAAAIRGLLEDMIASPYQAFHVEFEEIIDLGNGVAFSVNIFTGHPVGISGEVQSRYASVAIWTDGMIERFMVYTDTDEARAAAERLAEERG
jgi:ketosteroid isomerase-like protein